MTTKKRRTSVDLTPQAQKIKNHYSYLGLKNILSAGLILFGKQSSEDQLLSIQVACEANPNKKLLVGRDYVEKLSKLKDYLDELDKGPVGQGQITLDWRDFYKDIMETIGTRKLDYADEQQASDEQPAKKPKSLRVAIKEIVRRAKEQPQEPGQIIKITSSDEKLWSGLQQLIEPKKGDKHTNHDNSNAS